MNTVGRTDGRADGNAAAWRAAAIGVLGTWIVQLSAMPAIKLAAVDAGYVGGRRPARSEFVDLALSALGPGAWFGIALCIAAVIWLLLLEVRGRRVSRALAASLAENGRALPLLVLVGALAVRSYFDPGVPHAFDAKQHFAKVAASSQILADGDWPAWSWRWYGGMPLLRFYGPLLYVLSGAIGVITGPALGLKLTLAALHTGSGWALFAFVRTWSGSRRAAAVACIAYLLAFQRGHSLLGIGRLPEAPLYLLFPLLLLTVERFIREPSWKAGLLGGPLLAAMVLTHPMMGALGGVFAGAWAALRVIATGRLREEPWAVGWFAALTGGLGFALAAFWVLPAMDERPLVLLDRMYGGGVGSLVPTRFDFGDIGHLFAWGPPARMGASTAYAGLSLLFLAVVAARRHLRSNPAVTAPALALIALAFAYVGGGYFLTRVVVFLPVFLAAAAGWATAGSGERPLPSFARPIGWAGLAVLLVFVDLLPLTARTPNRPDLAPVEVALEALAPRTLGARAIVASRRGEQIDVSQWTGWDASPLRVLGGPFREAATETYGWDMALLATVRADLRDGGMLESRTVALLRLFGVRWIVAENGRGLVAPSVAPGPGYWVDASLPGVEIEGAGPLLYAADAAPMTERLFDVIDNAPDVADLPQGEDLDGWRRVLDALLDDQGMGGATSTPLRITLAAGAEPLRTPTPGPAVAVDVTNAETTHRTLRFDATFPGAGVVLLAAADYPGVTVSIDGAEVPHARSATGHCVAPVPAGEHHIEVHGPPGPRSGAGGWISLAGLALFVLLDWFARRGPPEEL